jgi:hypothetical protein
MDVCDHVLKSFRAKAFMPLRATLSHIMLNYLPRVEMALVEEYTRPLKRSQNSWAVPRIALCCYHHADLTASPSEDFAHFWKDTG